MFRAKKLHRCQPFVHCTRILYTVENINPFKYEAQTALFKDPVRTAQ